MHGIHSWHRVNDQARQASDGNPQRLQLNRNHEIEIHLREGTSDGGYRVPIQYQVAHQPTRKSAWKPRILQDIAPQSP
jgi:hypothetical protein